MFGLSTNDEECFWQKQVLKKTLKLQIVLNWVNSVCIEFFGQIQEKIYILKSQCIQTLIICFDTLGKFLLPMCAQACNLLFHCAFAKFPPLFLSHALQLDARVRSDRPDEEHSSFSSIVELFLESLGRFFFFAQQKPN